MGRSIEARLIVSPAVFPAARMQQSDGTTYLDPRVVAGAGEGPVVRGQRVVEPALDLQHHREIGPCTGEIRLLPRRVLEVPHSLFELAGLGQGHAAQVAGG